MRDAASFRRCDRPTASSGGTAGGTAVVRMARGPTVQVQAGARIVLVCIGKRHLQKLVDDGGLIGGVYQIAVAQAQDGHLPSQRGRVGSYF